MERMVRLAARLRKELSTNKDTPFNLRMLSRSPNVMLEKNAETVKVDKAHTSNVDE
jgi:hypothetical protein